MAKSGLSNQLLGKRVTSKPEYGNCPNDINGRVWAGLRPSMDGTYTAEIDAAWIENGRTRIAVHDPFGNVAEMTLTMVNIFTK